MTRQISLSGRVARVGALALRPALIIGPLALAVLLLGLWQLPRQQRAATGWVDHTLEVLEQTTTLEADLARSVAWAQTYLLGREDDSRQRFDEYVANVSGDVAALRGLTADNPVQQAAITRLAPLIDERFALLRDEISRQEPGAVDPVRAGVLHAGSEIGGRMRGVIVDMKAEERRLLSARGKLAHRAAMHTLAGLLVCGVAAAACAAVVTALLAGRRATETAHLEALRRLNASLEEKVAARTAELAASRSRLGVYVDHLGDGLVAVRIEPDGRFVYEEVNTAAREMLGVGAEVIGCEMHEVWPQAQARASEERMASCVAGRVPVRYGTRFGTKYGPRELRLVMAPVPGDADPQGRIGLLLMSLRDVTRELAVEEQLRQAQRMEAVGQLTAGVAHDFNNHLQTILGGLEVLQERPHPDAEARHCVGMAVKAARHGATLSHRLLAFSRKQPLNPVALKPEAAVNEVAGLLGQTLGGGVRVETSVGEGTWRVNVDDAQLENCLINLALNARDAMPAGGVVRLGADNMGPDDAARSDLPLGEYVCFSVTDEGSGMSPETIQLVFEPFFTTKEVGKGTGLGLSMVQGFARQSGGDVRIASVLGVGTTIGLWLPRAADVADGVEPGVVHEAAVRGQGRVMVVDDDPAVAHMLSLFLRKGGFTPIVVATGEAALELLRSGTACDVLVADQSMPVMTGVQLIEEVTRLRPALPTLLVTGFDMVSGIERIAGRVEVLRKPFERQAFLRLVVQMLDHDPQEAEPSGLPVTCL